MKPIFTAITILFLLTACENNDKSVELLVNLDLKMQNVNLREFEIGYSDACRFQEQFKVRHSNSSFFERKINQIILKVDSIEYFTNKAISSLDKLKLMILKKENENLKFKEGNKHQILYEGLNDSKNFASRPLRLKSNYINSKSTEFKFNILIDDNGNPTKLALEIWKNLQLIRLKIIENVGNYYVEDNNFSHPFKKHYNATKNFNFFSEKNNITQIQEFEKYLNNSKSVFSDDRIDILEIFKVLSFDESYTNCKDWMRANFHGMTVIESLLKLSEIQNNILVARSLAFKLWSYKFPYNGYVFDTPISFSSGLTNIQLGDSLQIKVTNVLYSTSINPEVSVNDKNAFVKYKDRIAYVQVKPNNKGLNTFYGQTIRYLKNGRSIKQPWSWTVNVN